MEKIKIQRRRGRRKSVSFNPNHQYVEQSVDDYIKNGGRITRIERVNGSFQSFDAAPEVNGSVDEFLMDR